MVHEVEMIQMSKIVIIHNRDEEEEEGLGEAAIAPGA